MWDQEPTEAEQVQAIKDHDELEKHRIQPFDYGPDGLNRPVGAGGNIAYRSDNEKPAPIIEDFDSQLDYSLSEVDEARQSGKAVTDFDGWEQDMDALLEVQNYKELRRQFNNALVNTCNSGAQDIVRIRDKMATLKPNDPQSQKQAAFMIKVIRGKLEEGRPQ